MLYNLGMYLRRIARKNKDGSVVAYLQLAQNEWDPERKYARANVIYSFGREDEVDTEALARLVESISRFLEPEDAAKAQANAEAAKSGLSSVKFLESRSYGCTWLLDRLWSRFDMPGILRRALQGRKLHHDVERLIFAMVANRAVAPCSKLSMEEWVEKDACIEGLVQVTSQQLYRAMDELWEARGELEEPVYFSAATLLNLEVDLIYFDTTSTYFEVEPSESPETDAFRKLGYSKDKRSDLLQAVIGLAVTKEGIPIRCWVWPGNTSDMSVVDEVKRDLTGWKLGRVITVMDRGFSSEENLRTLQRAGGHYIVGEKMRSGKPETEAAMSRAGRFKDIRDNLQVKEIVVGDGARRNRYILCYNPVEAEKAKHDREKIIGDLKAELDSIRQLPGEAHTKAMCALRSHKLYGKYLKQLANGTLRLNQAAIQDAGRYDGKYLVRTSDDTLSPEDVALGYKQLTDIEDSFRTLKTDLDLRPVYHRREERIRAHITLCWLALLFVRVCEYKTGETWRNIRDEFKRMQLITFSARYGTFKQVTEPTKAQMHFLKQLELEPPRQFAEIISKPRVNP